MSFAFGVPISDFCRKITFFLYWTKVQYTNMMDPCMVFLNLCSEERYNG